MLPFYIPWKRENTFGFHIPWKRENTFGFLIPWKRENTFGFLMFPGSIEREHCSKMS